MKCVISLAISLLFIAEDFLLHSVVWKITQILWGEEYVYRTQNAYKSSLLQRFLDAKTEPRCGNDSEIVNISGRFFQG